jgi:hypothetical protein
MVIAENINRDPDVRLVLHAGDAKGGSERCDDSLFAQRAGFYDAFEDPFVLTPGDNEWTDCHRAAAGSYLPTERLARMREVFFPEPGRSGGKRELRVRTQTTEPKLVHGDEHIFEEERAYAGVGNLTRLETFGDTADHWLRVRVDRTSPEVFSWQPVTVP